MITAPPPKKHPVELRLDAALLNGSAWRCVCGTITYCHLPCCHNCGLDKPRMPVATLRLVVETDYDGYDPER